MPDPVSDPPPSSTLGCVVSPDNITTIFVTAAGVWPESEGNTIENYKEDGDTESAIVSIYYSEIVKTRGGKDERVMRKTREEKVRYSTLDELYMLVRDLVWEVYASAPEGIINDVLGQTFVYLDDSKGAIHIHYEEFHDKQP